MTGVSSEPGVFIPVGIDAIREIEGTDMVRVTYFVVSTDAPGPSWEVDLPELTEEHGVSVLGTSGIVYRAIHAGAEYEGRRRGLFIDPEDISSIFGLEDEGSPFIVPLEDVWMPASWFVGVEMWGDEPETIAVEEDPMARGEVYRVAIEAFRDAQRYTSGEIGLDELTASVSAGALFRSPVETEALRTWSEGQIEAARRAFPDQPLILRWQE
jgi:hypothetical protein